MIHTRQPGRVYIFDTTNRDGAQATAGPVYGIESVVAVARALAEARVDRIEAGFPASSEANFLAVQRISREIKGPMIFGLSRVPVVGKGNLDYTDINRAYNAIDDAANRGIHTFTVLFDPDSLRGYGYSRQQVVEGAKFGVDRARKLLGTKGQVEFSFQNATTAPMESVVEGCLHMIDAGADVINVPDTVGYATPEEISRLVGTLRGVLPKETMISIHCHDDLGNAVANSMAAISAGADIVECTINGIGERAGNTSLEEVLMNLRVRQDVYKRQVGFDATKLKYLSDLVAEHYGIAVQENKAIVGSNAFRHRSGIHQDGMVKGRRYEIMHPDDVGWKGESIGLTAQSGYSGVTLRLRGLGFEVDPKFVRDMVMPIFKKIADQKREITNSDLREIMKDI